MFNYFPEAHERKIKLLPELLNYLLIHCKFSNAWKYGCFQNGKYENYFTNSDHMVKLRYSLSVNSKLVLFPLSDIP